MNATGSRRPWPSDETPIEDLDLWTRALNALRRAGVRTVGGLRRKTDADLLRLRGFGPGALTAVRAVVPPPPTKTASTDRNEAVRPIQASEDS
jgi:DNA-directed RNA polymerase alpha subunit